jgi:predicted ATPase/DNA-binding CsgD family transcriptional regulator
VGASTATSQRGSVPIPRTRLIGREKERAVARSFLLEDTVPLLTLTGPGGVGKTRLALAIADDVTSTFADDVIFIDLAPLAGPALLPATIAHALHVVTSGDQPLIERLVTVLRPRHVLLILDNCEHLAAAVGTCVSTLLAACPALQVLATSRAPLQIHAEQRFPVEPLPVPMEAAPLAAIAQTDAVRLFTERARAVRPAFTLTEPNAAAVAALCRQLDGLPLAIELAAARNTILPPQELLAQMHNRLSWLSDGPRDLPARQRTVRDTIAWSYGLLDRDAQQQFRHLAIFVGGFTIDAAQRMNHSAAGRESDVVSGVSTLVDHALLRRLGPEHTPRFAMLETIRAFARERLAESGDAEAIGAAHASYFLAWAEHHHPNRVDDQERIETRVQRIEAELPNLRAALVWFAEQDDAPRLLRLTAALAVFWHLRTHLDEGRRWLERALAAAPDDASLPRGQALAGLALILWAQSHYGPSAVMAQASLDVAERQHDEELAANAYHVLGMIAEIQDQWDEAEECLTHACARWRTLGAKAEEAWALGLLCRVALGQGRCKLAARHAEQALALFRAVGHPAGVATALSRLAEISRGKGDDRRAAAAFHEALQVWAASGDRWHITLALAGLADLAAAHNQAPAAATLVGYLDALAQETGAPLFSAARLSRDRAMRGATAHLGDVRITELHAAGRTMTRDDAIAVAAAVAGPEHRHAGAYGRTALTAREQEVLRLMARMHTDQDIAEVLSLSRRTISGHVSHILNKLEVPTRRAAVARGHELGWLADMEP